MMVYFMVEWDIPKEKERQDDYWKFIKESILPLNEKLEELNCIQKDIAFGDNTGHIVRLLEFEDSEAFGKFWDDDEVPRVFSSFSLIVDNLNIRLGRPTLMKL